MFAQTLFTRRVVLICQSMRKLSYKIGLVKGIIIVKKKLSISIHVQEATDQATLIYYNLKLLWKEEVSRVGWSVALCTVNSALTVHSIRSERLFNKNRRIYLLSTVPADTHLNVSGRRANTVSAVQIARNQCSRMAPTTYTLVWL